MYPDNYSCISSPDILYFKKHTGRGIVMAEIPKQEHGIKHITIIEDDIGLNNGIVLALKHDEYAFRQLYRLGDYKYSEHTDLIILDINLPDGSGFDFLKELRKTSGVPVIILTANDLETDEVTGLELGADIISQNRSA